MYIDFVVDRISFIAAITDIYESGLLLENKPLALDGHDMQTDIGSLSALEGKINKSIITYFINDLLIVLSEFCSVVVEVQGNITCAVHLTSMKAKGTENAYPKKNDSISSHCTVVLFCHVNTAFQSETPMKEQ